MPLQFNVMVNVIFSSPATVAAILAYLLDCTHLYWEASVKKDRGWFWWEKFKSYKYDARSEEFYRLPYGLSRYFPSLWDAERKMTDQVLCNWWSVEAEH